MQYESLFQAARRAGMLLSSIDPKRLDSALCRAAELLRTHSGQLLEANTRDVETMTADSPLRDRLLLTPTRIEAIASDMQTLTQLHSPQGEELERRVMTNGMTIVKRRVPFGVVGMICEARPNVTADIFALCIKTGNACVLKGGSDARHTNQAMAELLGEALRSEALPPDAFTLLPSDHSAAAALLNAVGYVDVVIPRGGAGLIRFVRENARVPIIETGAGIVHTYFDLDGDLEKGRRIIHNAKTRRVSVCNALDCLLIHRSRLCDLAALCAPLAEQGVTIYADADSLRALAGHYPAPQLLEAQPDHFGTEFLDLKLAIKCVDSLEQALEHIERHSSRHSEAIITENLQTAARFTSAVDAACLYVNISTAFTDGGQFGMGAEVGISTQKLHARGPMGLSELTCYKYIVTGDGQTREP